MSGERIREFQLRNQLESEEALTSNTIELCGTPYPHRFDQVVHNTLEDFLTLYFSDEIKGYSGMPEFNDFPPTNKQVLKATINTARDRFLKIRSLGRPLTLMMDTVFQSSVYIEASRRVGLLADHEADQHIKAMLPLIGEHDLIVATIINPRLSLSRIKYPSVMDGYPLIRQSYLECAYLYNECFDHIKDDIVSKYPGVSMVVNRIEGDKFLEREILFHNIIAIFNHLNIPSKLLDSEVEAEILAQIRLENHMIDPSVLREKMSQGFVGSLFDDRS